MIQTTQHFTRSHLTSITGKSSSTRRTQPSSPSVTASQAPRPSAADRHPRPSAARAAQSSHSQHLTRAPRSTSPRSAGRSAFTPPAPCVPRGASRRRAAAARPSGTSPSFWRTRRWRPSVERSRCASGGDKVNNTNLRPKETFPSWKDAFGGKCSSAPATLAEAVEWPSPKRPTSLLPTSRLGSTVR